MARIRTIKPEFWLNESLSSISECALILAAALLNYADDEGYFNANEALIKAACFPIREPSVSIHGALTELSVIGYIRMASCAGRKYGHILNFEKHQRINRPTKSTISNLNLDWLTEDSLRTHGGLTEDSLQERKGKEGNGRERISLGMAGKSSSLPVRRSSLDVVALEVATDVIAHLNKTCGKAFTVGGGSSKHLRARCKAARSETDLYEIETGCKLIVDHKFAEWGSDPRMKQYLRPETLFGTEHWESYLQAAYDWDDAGCPPISRARSNGKLPAETMAEKSARVMAEIAAEERLS